MLIVFSGAQLDGVSWMYLIRYYQPDKDSMLFFQVTYDINSSKGVEEERGAQTSFAFSEVVDDDDDDDDVDDDDVFLKHFICQILQGV